MQLTKRALQTRLCGLGQAVVASLRRFRFARRGSMALESVVYLTFIVTMTGGAFEILNFLHVNDLLERAARAVARDHALQDRNTATHDELLNRAWDAIRAKMGERLDRDLVTVDIKVYENPSKLLKSEVSTGANSQLGGDPGDMVVVRVGYTSTTALSWLRQQLQSDDTVAFGAMAVARNEILSLEKRPDPAAVPDQENNQVTEK